MASEEKRKARRQRVLKEGRIISLDNTQPVVNCTLRDVSVTGARLKCGDQLSVPRQFFIQIGQEATMHPGRVAWRRGKEVGVLFTGDSVSGRKKPPPLPAAAPPLTFSKASEF